VLVKVFPAGHLEAAFYLRYDFNTQKMMVIVAGNDLNGQVEFLSSHLSQNAGQQEPFGIIISVITRYFVYLETQRRQLDHSVIMMERVTGRGPTTYSAGEPLEAEDPDPDELSQQLRNMHWIGGNQRNIIYAMDFQLRLTMFLVDAHRTFLGARLGWPILKVLDAMPVHDRAIQETLQAHIVSVKGVLEDSRVIGERAQFQLNAVSD
jgi:hypothetical protein